MIVGVAIATYYAISAWSQVLVWPASQAPFYQYAWQSCIALWVLCIAMTCALRYIDVRYLLPRRIAFAEGIDAGEVVIAGVAVTKNSLDGEADDAAAKTAHVDVKDVQTKGTNVA